MSRETKMQSKCLYTTWQFHHWLTGKGYLILKAKCSSGDIVMEWGMKNRLSRLIQKDGKAVFLPIDHGYFQGPIHGLEKPGETIKQIYQYADAIMLTQGSSEKLH